jgi:hypothetical protein
MLERRRPQRQSQSPGGGNADFSSTSDGGLVTVSHGVHTEALPVANMTVSEIHTRFADRFDIDPESTALLDGNEVTGETIVQGSQLLMFVRKAGVKGVS